MTALAAALPLIPSATRCAGTRPTAVGKGCVDVDYQIQVRKPRRHAKAEPSPTAGGEGRVRRERRGQAVHSCHTSPCEDTSRDETVPSSSP